MAYTTLNKMVTVFINNYEICVAGCLFHSHHQCHILEQNGIILYTQIIK